MISVVVAAYNAELWLAQTMDSILQQTYPHFELLIVNDGSSDSTGKIIDAYATRDERVKPVHHPNWGLCASLNHAIGLAQHEWIARMDADDLMMPDRFERQIAFIQEHPGLAVAATLAHIIDAEGNLHWMTSTGMPDRESFERYRRENRLMPIYHNTVMMRKSIVDTVGGYRPEYYPCEDMDLWNRIADTGELILIQPERLVKYRVHDSSASVAATQTQYLKERWVLRSTACRRAGLPEPTLEEFRDHQRGQSPRQRFQAWRELRAQVLYKNSTVMYINGKRGRAMIPLAGSLLLHPSRWIEKLKPKFVLLVRHRSLLERF
jgi:glycosyltransferase involved in cell wall biosynthesis